MPLTVDFDDAPRTYAFARLPRILIGVYESCAHCSSESSGTSTDRFSYRMVGNYVGMLCPVSDEIERAACMS